MNTPPNVNDFWLAINDNNDDEAMAVLRREALPQSDGTPSPRVAALIKDLNWDSAQLLSLVCIREGACAGKIANDAHRFCGKYHCVTIAHNKGEVTMPPGWYISAGSGANGCFRTPSLPLREEGGPISNQGATMLTDGDPPFRLNRAQWVFLMEGWDPGTNPVTDIRSVAASPGSGTSWEAAFEEVKEGETVVVHPVEDVPAPRPPPLTIEVPPPPQPTNLSGLNNRFLVLEEMARANNRRIIQLEDALVAAENQASRQQTNAENVRAELTRLARHVMANPSADRDGHPNSNLALAQRLDNLSFELLDEQGRFARLKAQLILLRERQESGGGVELNGIRFPARKNMLAWYEEREPVVGIFMDAHAMLHAIAPAVSTTTDTMRYLESQKRIEQSTGLESAVTTSFHTIVPSVFIGGNSKNVEGGVFAAL